LLTVTTPAGEASAQVFFLQGQDGQCSNTVTGDLTVTGQITATGATLEDLTVTGTVVLPDCPSGYAKDPASPAGGERGRCSKFPIRAVTT
jgi:hypothetical protein